jgi:transposase
VAVTRKQHTPQFKVKVALEAIKGSETLSVLGSRYGVHPTMIARWRVELLERAEDAFSGNSSKKEQTSQALEAELYEQLAVS